MRIDGDVHDVYDDVDDDDDARDDDDSDDDDSDDYDSGDDDNVDDNDASTLYPLSLYWYWKPELWWKTVQPLYITFRVRSLRLAGPGPNVTAFLISI